MRKCIVCANCIVDPHEPGRKLNHQHPTSKLWAVLHSCDGCLIGDPRKVVVKDLPLCGFADHIMQVFQYGCGEYCVFVVLTNYIYLCEQL